MTRWPWITILLVALILLSSLGREVYSSLNSGEQLARSMGHILLVIYGPILLAAILIEWGIRVWLVTRTRARPGTPCEHFENTET